MKGEITKTVKYYRRYFICPKCGAVNSATKNIKRKTPPGHRKWLWCYKCKRKINQIQISR